VFPSCEAACFLEGGAVLVSSGARVTKIEGTEWMVEEGDVSLDIGGDVQVASDKLMEYLAN